MNKIVVSNLQTLLLNTKISIEGDAVTVKPAAAGDVQVLFTWAGKADIPLYIYRQPREGGILLDVGSMNQILEIDTANLVAAVEPGVKVADLAAELANKGLRFIPADTPLYQHKTVGELVYEGCSNVSSLKYGFAKHFLMGMEVVLPSGELLKTGAKTVKNVTGYDMTRFFSGPYNNLGVSVKFLLKLLPQAESKKTVALSFKQTGDIFNFINDFRRAGITPSSVLWLDAAVQRQLRQSSGDSHMLIVEMDGVVEEVEKQQSEIRGLAENNNCLEIAAIPLEELLAKGLALSDEFKFAFTLAPRFVEEFYRLAAEFGVEAGLFGQLAEGKINVRFATFGDAEKAFTERLLSWTVEIGGFSSGKYRRMKGDQGEGPLFELEQRVKQSFDPLLILNR